MVRALATVSCRSLFRQLENLHVPCQYMASLMNFNDQKSFQTNSSIHNIIARNKHQFPRTNDILSFFQNSIFRVSIKFLTFYHVV